MTVISTPRAGWGGRIRTSAWRNQNPLPYRLATPQCRSFPGWRLRPPDHNALRDGPQPLLAETTRENLASRPARLRFSLQPALQPAKSEKPQPAHLAGTSRRSHSPSRHGHSLLQGNNRRDKILPNFCKDARQSRFIEPSNIRELTPASLRYLRNARGQGYKPGAMAKGLRPGQKEGHAKPLCISSPATFPARACDAKP